MLPVFLIPLPTLHIFPDIAQATLVLSVICVCPFVCEVCMKPVRISCQLTLGVINFMCVQMDDGVISDRENKRSFLAAVSQQHIALYIYQHFYTQQALIYQSQHPCELWGLTLYEAYDDVRGKDKWQRYCSHSATGRKVKHASGHQLCGTEQQIWFEGKQKVSFGEICLLALSWLLCKNLLFCNRDTRGSVRPTRYPLPLPSQS